MSRWTEREIGHLRYLLERNQGKSVWEMSSLAQERIKKRSKNAINHKIRELISEKEFNSDVVELEGEVFPAQVVSGYVVITLPDNSKVSAHHFLWRKHYGEIPNGMHVHHINSIRTDNRIQNLSLMSADDHLRYHHTGTFQESFALFSFLQEQGLWNTYLTYRQELIRKLKGESDGRSPRGS